MCVCACMYLAFLLPHVLIPVCSVNPVRAVKIEGFSKDWTTIQFSTRSIFSTVFNLPTPVRVSDLRLVPMGMKHSRLQVQMYGNQSPVGENIKYSVLSDEN